MIGAGMDGQLSSVLLEILPILALLLLAVSFFRQQKKYGEEEALLRKRIDDFSEKEQTAGEAEKNE